MPPRAKPKKTKTEKETIAPSPPIPPPGSPLESATQLVPAPYNPRFISDDSASGLRASLKRFGDIAGITWNQRTGHIVAGHQRVAQLKKLYGNALQIKQENGRHYLWAPETPDAINEGKFHPAIEFQVRVIDVSLAEEKAANISANNYRISGQWLQDKLNIVLKEIDLLEGFGELNLNLLQADAKMPEPITAEDLVQSAIKDAFEPNEIFPSSTNEWDIPDLLLDLQARGVEEPICKFGSDTSPVSPPGLMHFYTEDKKFERVWADPRRALTLDPKCCCEVNYSLSDSTPRAVALEKIYRKKWMARYWQKCGVRIFVDLGIPACFLDLALMGVPKGWLAYGTRLYSSSSGDLEAQYEAACHHAGTRSIIMFVMGGGADGKAFAKEKGLIFLPEFKAGKWAQKRRSERDDADSA